MKNPLKKENHNGLYAGIAASAAIGIALSWLFLTDKGAQYRRQITGKLNEGFSAAAADLIGKKNIIPREVAKASTEALIKD